ncbi:hypothetical protein HYZ97_04445 [Candidatus Pacearchaeota archaeon]|nr:hypothetical protein [Candidatus Pacearchaeota archaeon]
MKENKKGALELSIGTVVILVLGMSMLILGLILVRTIFTGATSSVDDLNDKVTNALASLFAEEGEDVVVRLGPDQTAKVKPDSGDFGVAIGARTLDGSPTTRERLKYTLKIEEGIGQNCVKQIGKAQTISMFKTALDQPLSFDKFDGSTAFARVIINVPKGTATCTQKVFIDVRDTQTNQDVGGNFFILEVLKEGLF